LSYFDPNNAQNTNIKAKHANLIFNLDPIVMKNANDMNQSNKDSFYRKALPAKIDYEKLSSYFESCSHDVLQNI
jgi:hypothetical protein